MQLFTRVSPNPDSLSFLLSFFFFQPPCRALYCTTILLHNGNLSLLTFFGSDTILLCPVLGAPLNQVFIAFQRLLTGIYPVQASTCRESTRILRNPPDLSLSLDAPFSASLLLPQAPFMLLALRPPATSTAPNAVSLPPPLIRRDPLAPHMTP